MAKVCSRELGFVSQQTHLADNLMLFENVTVVGYLRKERKPEGARKQAGTLLEQINVGNAKDRMPAEVSGGEAQRVVIARTMINEPGVIFANGPTGALNKGSTGGILDLLAGLNKEGQSILMVTHDLRAAVRGTRLLYPEDGKILDRLLMSVFHPEDERMGEAMIND